MCKLCRKSIWTMTAKTLDIHKKIIRTVHTAALLGDIMEQEPTTDGEIIQEKALGAVEMLWSDVKVLEAADISSATGKAPLQSWKEALTFVIALLEVLEDVLEGEAAVRALILRDHLGMQIERA